MLYINFIDTWFPFVFKQSCSFTFIHYIYILLLVSLNQNFYLLCCWLLLLHFYLPLKLCARGFCFIAESELFAKIEKFPSVVLHCRWVSNTLHTQSVLLANLHIWFVNFKQFIFRKCFIFCCCCRCYCCRRL